MHAIEHITIKGFKSIASIEKLELRPVNVVIGANGSGKSNLLEALAFLREIADGRLRSYVARAGGAEKVLHFGSKVTREMELRLFYGPGAPVQSYDLTLVASDDDGLVPTKEVVVKYGGHDLHISPGEAGREAGISQEEDRTHREYIRRVLWNLRLYHLNDTSSSSPILKTGSVDDNRFLRADGSNLAPLLYTLRALAQHSYRAIVKEVRRVAPFFQDFILEPTVPQSNHIKLEWKHRNSDRYFDASSLSAGTLRFIVLATLLLQPSPPPLILVDEPELGLHPYAISILALLVKQASRTSQIILSTQSPTLLDYFEPQDVLVAELENDATTLRRLEPEPLKEWLEDYSLGQLWEKNEFGGRPVPA